MKMKLKCETCGHKFPQDGNDYVNLGINLGMGFLEGMGATDVSITVRVLKCKFCKKV